MNFRRSVVTAELWRPKSQDVNKSTFAFVWGNTYPTVAQMGIRFATIDMGRKEGAARSPSITV